MFGLEAEIIVLTEARTTTPTFDGHLAFSEQSTAKRFEPDERKVAVWSKNPLEPVAFDLGIYRSGRDVSRGQAAKGVHGIHEGGAVGESKDPPFPAQRLGPR